MKKNLFIAALFCSISFAGKAATNENKAANIANKPVTNAVVSKPVRVKKLYMMDFHCEAQGWTIPVVGYTLKEMLDKYQYYVDNIAC